jgi:hypothetical protein
MPQQLPPKLQAYLSNIQGLRPLEQAIPFSPQQWQEHSHTLSALKSAFPEIFIQNKITRAVLMDAGQLASDGKISWDDFFVAVMMWGFGTTGYGPWRTGKMLMTPNFGRIFATIRQHLKVGDIKAAHQGVRIEWLGAPFFTKLFYFLGWVFELEPFPLILDARVARNLIKCNAPMFKAQEYFSYSQNCKTKQYNFRWSADGYINYCEDLNEWAAQYQCLPDMIEMFLFDPPNGF